MAQFLDYNPHKGTALYYEQDGNTLTTHTMQDLQPALDYTKEMRNSGKNDKVGDFNHYAIITPTMELELRNKGINPYRKEYTARLLKEIDENYPHMKVTNLRHRVKE